MYWLFSLLLLLLRSFCHPSVILRKEARLKLLSLSWRLNVTPQMLPKPAIWLKTRLFPYAQTLVGRLTAKWRGLKVFLREQLTATFTLGLFSPPGDWNSNWESIKQSLLGWNTAAKRTKEKQRTKSMCSFSFSFSFSALARSSCSKRICALTLTTWRISAQVN